MALDAMVSDAMYRRLLACKGNFGMQRLELGMLLELFRANPTMWQGRSQSFAAFLEEHHINGSGAYQWMRIARKLILDLRLPDETLRELSSASFSMLDAACRVINRDNVDEIVGIVSILSERDARVALDELSKEIDDSAAPNNKDCSSAMPNEVKALLTKFRRLPDDYRIEFLRSVRGQNAEHIRNQPRAVPSSS